MNALLPQLAQWLAAQAGDADAASPAAVQRRQAVMAMRAANELLRAVDQAAAATLLLPSSVVAEVDVAHALALAAMATEPSARSLAATAYDRLRMLAGKPQKFGTQVTLVEGHAELWPVDPTTTDSERAKWGLPTLAELLRRMSSR